MKPVLFLTSLLFSSYLAAAPTGFYQSYQDWDAVCSNLGTCYLAGYQADAFEERDSPPISVLFTRKAGENAPITGQISLLSQYLGEPHEPASKQVELKADGKSLGHIRLKDGTGRLTDAQTHALLAALKHKTNIRVFSGKTVWKLSDKGAAAAMLKADEFQGRLNTPSALIRKGGERHAVLQPQPMPVIRVVSAPKSRSYFIEKGNPRYAAVRALLQSKNTQNEEEEDYCPDLQTDIDDEEQAITVYPLGGHKALLETACIRGAYQTTFFYAVADDKLTHIAQVLPLQYGGGGGFDEKYTQLDGSFKGRGPADCYSIYSAVWNGQTFIESSRLKTGQCSGFMGGAWEMPILETRVIRKGKN